MRNRPSDTGQGAIKALSDAAERANQRLESKGRDITRTQNNIKSLWGNMREKGGHSKTLRNVKDPPPQKKSDPPAISKTTRSPLYVLIK